MEPDDPHAERPAHEQPGEVLTGTDWSAGVEMEHGQSVPAAISNAMVGLKKRFFGKGPRRAQTFIHGRYVFSVLEGGVTRHEDTLLDAGHEDEVRRQRLTFQDAMAKPTCEAVEQITGRTVTAYQSQIVFRPDVTVEFFVLDEPPGDA
jgi:uncharacterized protein YbcI